MSLDIATAERLARQIEDRQLVTAVGYHWRYLDTVEEARGLLADNPATLVTGYWLDQTPPPQWWWRQDRSGGQIVEQATHLIDLARHLVGEVTEVYAQGAYSTPRDVSRPRRCDCHRSFTSLRHRRGRHAVCHLPAGLGPSHRLESVRRRMAIELSDRDIMVDVGRGRPVRQAEGDPVEREDRDFLDAVRGLPNRIRCPYGEALKTHRVALAISQSATARRPVRIEAAEMAALHA